MKDTEILTAGDSSLLIQFGQEISPEINLNAFVHLMKNSMWKCHRCDSCIANLLIASCPRALSDYRKLKRRLENY